MEILNNGLNAAWSYLWVPLVIIVGFRIISYLAHKNNDSDSDKKE
jgi:hypothetical protein|tara:strand:+ start:54 stop:188 length:135 start_codon:yes stop_codon:yes gene_type:complete